ncbi:hypothetical protein DRQ53_14760 [bacterium]|nr:MAG: hypothetical protein DRQ53_14760 [bacterium]
MKLRIITFALACSVLVPATAPADPSRDLRNVTWGMSREEVIAAEDSAPVTDQAHKLIFVVSEFHGCSGARVQYLFDRESVTLTEVRVVIKLSDLDQDTDDWVSCINQHLESDGVNISQPWDDPYTAIWVTPRTVAQFRVRRLNKGKKGMVTYYSAANLRQTGEYEEIVTPFEQRRNMAAAMAEFKKQKAKERAANEKMGSLFPPRRLSMSYHDVLSIEQTSELRFDSWEATPFKGGMDFPPPINVLVYKTELWGHPATLQYTFMMGTITRWRFFHSPADAQVYEAWHRMLEESCGKPILTGVNGAIFSRGNLEYWLTEESNISETPGEVRLVTELGIKDAGSQR